MRNGSCVILLCLAMSIQIASAQPKPPTASAAPSLQPIAKYALERGLTRCARALDQAERNLLGGSEYAFRAYHPARANAQTDIGLFTAIVDSRKVGRGDVARATLNITVSNSPRNPAACNTMYEQTRHHNISCETVVQQMVPNGRQSPNPVLGAVLFEVTDTLSVTVIPAGTAQCITIVKESAFDLPVAGIAR